MTDAERLAYAISTLRAIRTAARSDELAYKLSHGALEALTGPTEIDRALEGADCAFDIQMEEKHGA